MTGTGSYDGRLVETVHDLELVGDHCLIYEKPGERGEIAALWMVLPGNDHARIAAVGHGVNGEPEWQIECVDGRVTVSPSIADPRGFHGYLRDGVWSYA